MGIVLCSRKTGIRYYLQNLFICTFLAVLELLHAHAADDSNNENSCQHFDMSLTEISNCMSYKHFWSSHFASGVRFLLAFYNSLCLSMLRPIFPSF